jgi:hypothetical protein
MGLDRLPLMATSPDQPGDPSMRVLTLALVPLLAATASFAADNGNGGQNAGGHNAGIDPATMAKMMELMKPGPEHQQLAKMAGAWDVDAKMWMDPKAPPTASKGKAQFTPMFDGRFVRQDYQGDMMGTPFTGIGYDGFDRGRGVFTTVWLDSIGTAMMPMIGKASADGKTITYEGEMFCPMLNKVATMRSVCTRVSDSEVSYDMFVIDGDRQDKSMELRYHRVPAAK